jgi:hypothetical protein
VDTLCLTTYTPRVPQCLSTPIVRIGTPPPPPLPQASVYPPPPPPNQRRRISPAGEGVWGSQFGRLKKQPSTLSTLYSSHGSHSFLLSPSSLHPKESVTHRRQAKLHCALQFTYCTSGRYAKGAGCSLEECSHLCVGCSVPKRI